MHRHDEVDVDDDVAMQIESAFARMEADVRKGDFNAPFRQGDIVKPECIGGCTGLIDFIEYGCANQAFAAEAVADVI